ncbi:DNA-formamidopyrimidine glycosylase family protein [Chitinophaga barathri]|uniref:Fpg/Nei family DNA glycosylase n=1 Tax=Chitinophaga barathri TaxID=1647451 RepID=A0A3N4M5B3_9BACT|nr:DNA-formamidopyrimidine glycosylase family protein [Chitinophaga barathri]RPD38125.1 Fpg/Nei family DNA glycosylase [Chitinophaga barathri]
MPELPDLEVFSKHLQQKLRGKKLKALSKTGTWKKDFLRQPLRKVYREGKELRFLFGNGHILGLHLMLHGKLVYEKENSKPAHTVFTMQFDDGSVLSVTDWQKKARITPDPELSEVPDALSKEFSSAYLKRQLEGSRAAVKKLLIDQHKIRGIGNAYADEILYDARISPFSIAGKIPDAASAKLVRSVKKVLKDAVKKISKDHPDIIAGEVRDFMRVHLHGKEKSPGGKPIEHMEMNGRNTYFTEEQIEYK